MPGKAKAKLIEWVRESVRSVVKVGNRQIRESKRALGKRSAKGVLLVANDNNYGFGPKTMVAVLSDAVARLKDNHVDVVVYFTPNVFHRKLGSDVAWTLWEPRYRDGSDLQLPEFINELGRKWHDYTEVITGDVFVERNEAPSLDHSQMQPVRRLGRN